MTVPGSSLAQLAAARISLAEAALFKTGQTLQALVLGKTAGGLTQLKIGDVLVQATLPSGIPAGTSLQLQVKVGGANPQMVMVSQTPASGQPAPSPLLVVSGRPVNSGAVVTVDQTAPTERALPSAPAASSAGPLPAAPQTSGASAAEATRQGQAASPPVPTAVATATPGNAGAARLPTAPQPVQGSVPAQVQAAKAESSQPVVSLPSQNASTASSSPGGGTSPAAVQPASPLPQAAPSSTGTLGRPPQSPTVAPAAAQPGAAAPLTASALAVSPGQSEAVGAGPSPVPATAPPVAAGQPAAVLGAGTPLAAGGAVPPGQPLTATSAGGVEQEMASPLLMAQTALRPAATMADLPRGLSQSAPQQTASPIPATPQAALSQMLPEAMARQDSIAPLLSTLAALVAKPKGLPPAVLRAAVQLLGQRAVLNQDVAAGTIKAALAGSGVLLERLLSKGISEPDMKSALLAFKAALTNWTGPVATQPPGPNRASPPLRGDLPRVELSDLPLLSDTPGAAARLLHGQADAALARVKLMQLASLPDAVPTSSRPPELRMDVPFLFGQELVMAQFQVNRDGSNTGPSERKRGWTMRFAMRFAATGEVGAEIGLLGKSVNVALWADEPEMEERLNAMLPDLSEALLAIGLSPGAIRSRKPPDPAKPAKGHFVDAMS